MKAYMSTKAYRASGKVMRFDGNGKRIDRPSRQYYAGKALDEARAILAETEPWTNNTLWASGRVNLTPDESGALAESLAAFVKE